MVSISTVARMVPCGMPSFSLAHREHVVPEPRFEMALHFRQIEIRTRSALQLRGCVVEEEQPEIEQRCRYRLTIHQHVLLGECQPRGLTTSVAMVAVQAILLALGTGEFDFASHRIAKVQLAFDVVSPRRGI